MGHRLSGHGQGQAPGLWPGYCAGAGTAPFPAPADITLTHPERCAVARSTGPTFVIPNRTNLQPPFRNRYGFMLALTAR